MTKFCYEWLQQVMHSRGRSQARVRHLNPALRLSNIAELAPCRRPEDVAKYVEGMQKAGLPE